MAVQKRRLSMLGVEDYMQGVVPEDDPTESD